MKRFFSKELTKNSSELKLTGDEFHHLKNVLRLKADEKIEVINGTGLLAFALIDKIDRHSARLIIEETPTKDLSAESPINITLLQGVLKRTTEEAVTSATVLGVAEVRLFTSEFTAAKPAKE
ncbi:MAG: RsmE family RNA methyltransferase, partial [Proteobacteria bacterium]|nr:RsmE family RNA methyltransferase [Pseudomonadota bacterium]